MMSNFEQNFVCVSKIIFYFLGWKYSSKLLPLRKAASLACERIRNHESARVLYKEGVWRKDVSGVCPLHKVSVRVCGLEHLSDLRGIVASPLILLSASAAIYRINSVNINTPIQ